MTQFETWLRNDLQQIPEVTVLDGNFFSADNTANRIGVIVTDNGEPATLSEAVTGYVIRSDNESFYFQGDSDGNRCWIDLTAECYTEVGPISIVIKVGATTVGACTGYVYRTLTDTIIDPGHVIPSIEELLEKVALLEAATTAANTAAGSANSAAAYANQMAEEASRVDVEMTKSGKVLTFTATNRNNMTVTRTSQEPTLRVTRNGTVVTVTATDADGTTSQDIEDTPVDDTAGTGETVATWSADKITSELNLKLNTALKGTAGGLAELDQNGKVPANQLPSFVDDVVECTAVGDFPLTGETGKIYVALDTNLTYRWSGSQYVEISKSLALGETSSTAFRGDQGKAAYDHAMAKGNEYTAGLYVITTNAEGHVVNARPATKADIGLGNVDNTADIDKPSSAATRQSEQNAQNYADNAQNSQYNAEAWAVGQRNGTDVGTTDETYENNAKHYAEQAEDAKDTILGMSAQATTLPEGSNATASYLNGLLSLGIPKGDTGDAGRVTNYTRTYQNGSSGTEIPSGNWSTTRVAPVQGQYLWTKIVLTWNDGSETLLYNVAYQGIDGTTSAAQFESRVHALEERVPAPASADSEKYLKGDGTWSNVPDPQVMTGATEQANGTEGLVPAPASADREKYLKGNGTWSEVPNPSVMTGATSSAAGASGLVPTPSAGDQDKMLSGGGVWALPGVVTINGRSPNPVTGDIVVIEGGGSSSYGSYRLDAVIATTDWVASNGRYVAQVSNQYITANMDGNETWLDDESAMLGETSFTTSEGLLTISTAVQPTASWNLHVSLAVNGADVLADVSNLQTTVGQLQTTSGTYGTHISNLQSSFGIVCDGNKTTIAASVGQFIILKNSTISGCTDGLYTASKDIPSNTVIDSTYLATVSSGGLNKLDGDIASLDDKIGNVGNTDLQTQVTSLDNKIGNVGNTDLQSQITSLNSKIANVENADVTIEAYLGVTINYTSVTKHGKQVCGTIGFTMTANTREWTNAFRISKPPNAEVYATCLRQGNGEYAGMCKIFPNTAVQIYSLNALTNQSVSVTFAYRTA